MWVLTFASFVIVMYVHYGTAFDGNTSYRNDQSALYDNLHMFCQPLVRYGKVTGDPSRDISGTVLVDFIYPSKMELDAYDAVPEAITGANPALGKHTL
jgi:hypothetical protein